MPVNQIEIPETVIPPPLPFAPYFFEDKGSLFLLSRDTEIPDLFPTLGLKGHAKLVPNKVSLITISRFQDFWRVTKEYQALPYEFTHPLEITLSHNATEWAINRDKLEGEWGYYARVKYIGQKP